MLKNDFYYIDTNVLLENTPHVKFMYGITSRTHDFTDIKFVS